MSLNDKIISMAMKNAMSSIQEQVPSLTRVIDTYGELQTKEAKHLQAILLDITALLKDAKLPIDISMVELIIKVTAINVDNSSEKQAQVKKLFKDLSEALKDGE